MLPTPVPIVVLAKILDRKLCLYHELDNYVWTHIVKSKIEVYGCSMRIVSTRSSTVYVLSSLEKIGRTVLVGQPWTPTINS